MKFVLSDYEKELFIKKITGQLKDDSIYIDYVFVINSFSNDYEKVKYLKYLKSDYECYLVIVSFNNDDLKIECLKYLEEEYYKALIAKTLMDDYKKLELLENFKEYYQQEIIESIKDINILKELYKHVSYEMKKVILKIINDDVFKQQELGNYLLSVQLDILKTFKNQKLLVETLIKGRYQPYVVDFLKIITEEELIIKLFDSCQYDMYCLKIINHITNEEMRRKLIKRLRNNFYRIALESNYDDNKQLLINSQDVSEIEFNLDPEITFGLELEVCNSEWNTILTLKNILEDWKIVWDVSLKEGVEFVSPILKFCEKDLKTIKFLCRILKDNEFYINDSCGGHIHFGFDYFKTIDEFNVFLNLYGNVEDILYLISNQCGSLIRGRVLEYAKKLQPILEDVNNLEINFDKCQEIGEYVKLITNNVKTKYYGLNLLNANSLDKNTIEFRMPNGEFNFDELILNIRLFGKLLEVSKKINKLLNGVAKTRYEIKLLEYYNKMISRDMDDKLKLSFLLNMLFEDREERDIYYRRYVNNRMLNPCRKENKKVFCLKKKWK